MTAPAAKGMPAWCRRILQGKGFSFDSSPAQAWKSRWVFSSSASSAAATPSPRAKASFLPPGASASVVRCRRWNLMCKSLDDAEEETQATPAG